MPNYTFLLTKQYLELSSAGSIGGEVHQEVDQHQDVQQHQGKEVHQEV